MACIPHGIRCSIREDKVEVEEEVEVVEVVFIESMPQDIYSHCSPLYLL
jgi:hypothetical protein